MKRKLILVFGFWFIVSLQSVHAGYDVSVCAGTVPSEDIAEDCLDLMESFPEPTVVPIREDLGTISNYSFWRVMTEGPNVYDGPGGNVLRQMAAGYNFVNVVETSGKDWVQIETGEWMQTADLDNRTPSYFTGVRILNGLDSHFAWILGTHITSPYPGAEQSVETGRVVFRYDRVNIFAEAVDDEGWIWYMVGPNEWVEQRMVSMVSKIERPEDVEGRWVAVDLYEQNLVAYEDDTPVFATIIATGLPGTDTNEGLFTVWARLERDGMSGATGAPTAYDLQSVPWVMYFDDSISLHGTYWHDDFGYRRSRGCVNMTISDAGFVYEWFLEGEPDDNGALQSYVYVHSSGEYRTSGAATK